MVKIPRLRFSDELERAFREDYFQNSLGQLRFGIVLGTVLYALFGILDQWIFPEVKLETWFIRYALFCPAAALTVLFTYSRRFKKYMQPAVLALVVLAGSGIIAMIVIVHSPVNYFHFAGLLLVIMYSYTFSKLRFWYASIACWLLVGLYEYAALRIAHTPFPVFMNDNFFYISANLIGMFSNYHRELYMRKDFVQTRTVKELEEQRHFLEKESLHVAVEKATKSLMESEGKFRTLAQTAAMAIFIHQGGNFLYANRAAESIGGYTVEEYLRMNFLSLVHPDYLELVTSRARERLDGGDAPPQYEFKIVKKSGEERWVLMTAGTMDYEGKPAVIGTLIDITSRKQAEEERYQMAMLIENSSDFIGMSTLDGRLLFINSAGRKLVGIDSEADVRKTSIADYFMPEDLPVLREQLLPKDAWRGEFRLRHRTTGLPIPVEMYGFNVTDEKTKQPVARAAVIRDITDLKRAQEEREQYYQQLQRVLQSLKESEARFRTLAETTTASIIIHRGGKFLYTNPAVQKGTGFTQDELMQMKFWEIVHPECRDMVKERGQGRISGIQAPLEYEFKLLTKNLEERWAIASAGVIEFEGEPAVIATLFDITDRKRAEEKQERLSLQLQQALQSLKESEAKFRSLAETAPAAIFIHQGGKFLYANAASEVILGYTRKEFLTMDFWGVTHPEDKELIIQRGRSRFSGDVAPQRYEFRIVTKSGEVRWVDMTVGMIEYEGKASVIGTAFDITARKQAEEERERLNRQLQQALRSLQESEAKFRTLAETTTAAIFIHRGGKFFYANPAGIAIAGYTNEEFKAMDFWSIIHPDYQELVKERGRARLRGDQLPPTYEFKIITKNGEERWVNMTVGIINYEEGPAVIGTLFDITDRKRAEEEKVKLYEERIAEEKKHILEKEKILMDLHDGIGGITTNISILSELAQKTTDVENKNKTLATISRLSKEGISEIRSFMHSLDSRELSWRTLAAELRNQGTTMVEPHNILFDMQTSIQELEAQPTSLLCLNTYRIFKESLTNVIKHSKASSAYVTLEVSPEKLFMLIIDNGIGMKSGKGGGRGMTNMKTRAEEIGGTLTVRSDPGLRICLEVPLPLKYPDTGMVN